MVSLVFKDVLNGFLQNNALIIALGFIGLIVVTVVALLIGNRKKD